MPEADQEIFREQPRANIVDDQGRPIYNDRVTVADDNIGQQQQESLTNGGNAGAVAEDAEDDGWMEAFVDLEGLAN